MAATGHVDSSSTPGGRSTFVTTRWSLLLHVGAGSEGERNDALAEICGRYWYPLYAYLRRDGEPTESAADLVQGLFADLLQRGDLASVRPAGGRFRSWLLAALRHHRSHVRERARALKRGEGQRHLSLSLELDSVIGESERAYLQEPEGSSSPEALFERRSAEVLIRGAFERLAVEERRADAARCRTPTFDELSPWLHGERPEGGYAALVEGSGRSEGALKARVHRLRARWRQLLLGVVAEQVARPQDVEDEVRALFAALESPKSP